MSKKLDNVQRRAEEAKALAVASRERVEKENNGKKQEKLRALAQKRELKAHQWAQRASLLSKIENGEISKNEANRIKATRARHRGYDFIKKFVTLGRKENPITTEQNEIIHNGKSLRNKGRVFLGGTKPMYEYNDLSHPGKTWLCKEAVTCVGTAKPAGALVSEAAYRLQNLIDPQSAIETFVQRSRDGKRVLGSFQERVAVDKNAVDLFRWQADPQRNLENSLTSQILREHATDWLLCNFDTKGENFVIDTDGRLRGIDKEQAFRFLGDKKAQNMSHDYSPNPNETLYDTIFKKYSKNEMDLDLQTTAKFIQRVENIPNDVYLNMFHDAIESTCKGDQKRVKDMEDHLLQRKEGLRDQYRKFYTEMTIERYGEKAKDYLGADGAFAFDNDKKLEHTVEVKAEKAEKAEKAPQVETQKELDQQETLEKQPEKVAEIPGNSLHSAMDATLLLARGLPAFPLGERLENDFPGVDPLGKHSRIDLSYERRIAAVKARLPLCDEAVQAEFKRLEASPGLAKAKSGMAQESIQYGMLEHTAYRGLTGLPPEEQNSSAQSINALLEKYKGSPSVRLCGAYLRQAEYLTGLHTDQPSRRQTALLKSAELLAGEDALKQAGKRCTVPARLSVPFENSENWAWRRYLLQSAEKGPAALGNALENYRSLNGQQAGLRYEQNQLESYADTTIKQILTPAFEGMKSKHPGLNQMDYIFIDGESISQLLKKLGADNSPTAEMEGRMHLVTALQTNQHVRVYLPDPVTKIPGTTPTTLVREGYEPQPLNKPHRNAWERFWSKRDFYKEKAEQLKKYKENKTQLKQEAASVQKSTKEGLWQERLADCKRIAEEPPRIRQEFEESLHLKAQTDGQYFRSSRSGATIAACILLRDHQLEDILDPGKLREEKLLAGQEAARLRERDDPGEFAALMVPAAQKLISRPEPRMDFSSLHSYAQHPVEITASQLLFEMNQEMSNGKTACAQYLSDRGGLQSGKSRFDLLDEQSSNRGNYFYSLSDGAKAFVKNVGFKPEQLLEESLAAVSGMDLFLKQQEKGHSLMAQTPLKASSGISNAMTSADHLITRENKAGIARPIMEGRSGELFTISLDSDSPIPEISGSALQMQLSTPAKEKAAPSMERKSPERASV